MNKNKFTIILLIMLLVTLSGCQLAKPEQSMENTDDKLIGAFITFEYLNLYDTEKFFDDNAQKITDGDELVMTDEYQQRLYGTLTEDHVCEFEGIEGVGFIADIYTDENGETYSSVGNNEYVSEVGIKVSDNSYTIEGTITVKTENLNSFYLNPVYKTADGRIYLLSGTGLSFDGFDGAKASQTIAESYTTSEGSATTEESFEVIVNYVCEAETDKYILKEFNDKDTVINETEITKNNIPEKYTKQNEQSYIIIEKINNNEVVSREIVKDEYFNLYFFDYIGVSKIYYVGLE